MTARDVLRRPGYNAVGRQTSVLQQLHSNYIQRSVAGQLCKPVELLGRTGAANVLTAKVAGFGLKPFSAFTQQAHTT